MRRSLAIWMVLGLATAVGVALRYALRGHTTPDTFTYLLPWYRFAAEHGWGALDVAFTNYAPFFGYLLIAVTRLDGLAEPLTLIKSISWLFEFATAVLAFRFARSGRPPGASAWPPAVAFAAVWLAPTVIFNGPMWGQVDSAWGFLLLLSAWLFCRGGNGSIPFGLAFAAKAQGVFLGPFVLGLALRRRMHWLWLAAPAAAYAALAAPVVLAGRPIGEVAQIYLAQAGAYDRLYKGAPNPWLFVPNQLYEGGVVVGLVIAAVVGLALAAAVARSRRTDTQFLLLAACASLFLGPFLLPKMHDRYFYAFEVAAIVLACMNPRYAALAVVAQVDGVLAYLAFDRGMAWGPPIAAACNLLIGLFLIRELRAETLPAERTAPATTWAGYGIAVGLLAAFLAFGGAPAGPTWLVYAGVLGLIVLQTMNLLRGAPIAERGAPGLTPAKA